MKKERLTSIWSLARRKEITVRVCYTAKDGLITLQRIVTVTPA